MTVNKIAILSPGDMGHAVGRALSEHGFDILTLLEGRSERTRDLAQDAGFRISTSPVSYTHLTLPPILLV